MVDGVKMGLFYIDDKNINYEAPNKKWSFPRKLNFVENTCEPHKVTGLKSGAYVIASFLECVIFQQNDSKCFNDNEVNNIIYNPSKTNISEYISLKSGIEKACGYIHDTLKITNISTKNLIWFNTLESCKRYIHRNNYIIVEMKANSSLLNYDEHIQGSNFIISTNGHIVSSELSKGFVCCGYDEDGFIVMNTLGQSYGSSGFVKITNDVFNENFIKGVTINNIVG